MIILISTGSLPLSHSEMDELMAQCGASTWYQIRMPKLTDPQDQAELESKISATCESFAISKRRKP